MVVGCALAIDWTGSLEAYVSHDADVALLRAAVAADARAEAQLVGRLVPVLRAVARTIVGSGSDADDAVQISLMRVLERASTYRGDAPLEGWARTIGVRACLRMVENQRRHRASDAPIDEDDVAGDTNVDDALVDALPGPITTYLERLPEAQRQALVLRHALGYGVAEVAELLGVPIDTAKSRLMFGLRALRKAIRRDQLVGTSGVIGGRRG